MKQSMPSSHMGPSSSQPSPGVRGLQGWEQPGVSPHTLVFRFLERLRVHEGSGSNLKTYPSHARITDTEIFSYPCKDRSWDLRAVKNEPKTHSKHKMKSRFRLNALSASKRKSSVAKRLKDIQFNNNHKHYFIHFLTSSPMTRVTIPGNIRIF